MSAPTPPPAPQTPPGGGATGEPAVPVTAAGGLADGEVATSDALARPVSGRGSFGAKTSGDTSGYGRLVRPTPFAPSAERPYGEPFDALADELARVFPDLDSAIERVVLEYGELTFHVAREHLLGLCTVLRDSPGLRFELASSVSGVDYLDDPTGRRLHVVYQLTSMTHRRRLRLEVSVTAEDAHVPSVVGLWPGADWHERETWDMFGVVFDGHPGLTRIMMPDDWAGHPQRKDYPLGGIAVQYTDGRTVAPPETRRSYA